MNSNKCVVCSATMKPEYTEWHLLCAECGYEQGRLEPAINAPNAHQEIDEQARETGLRDLRQANFERLVGVIKRCWPSGRARLLDVGAAHGWFLDAASPHFQVMGIEPDIQVFNSAQEQGKPVRQGYFPDVLQDGECFDIIAFNDVIEHIPDIKDILTACHSRLPPGGLLVLNLPSSKGVFYRLAKLMHSLGMHGPFERLWQKGLPSPHVHYFHAENLSSLLQANGFSQLTSGRLPTLQLRGLFTRISYTGEYNLFVRCFLYTAIMCALPLLQLMPADIVYSVFRREEKNQASKKVISSQLLGRQVSPPE